jgi:hypothetical protein
MIIKFTNIQRVNTAEVIMPEVGYLLLKYEVMKTTMRVEVYIHTRLPSELALNADGSFTHFPYQRIEN